MSEPGIGALGGGAPSIVHSEPISSEPKRSSVVSARCARGVPRVPGDGRPGGKLGGQTMTAAGFLARSFDSAAFLCAVSGFVMVFAPRAQRAWEERLARDAASACVARGGTALTSWDRVVSCLPEKLAKGRLP